MEQQHIVEKKTRKPRTKKADMIKKKEEMEKLKALQPPKKRGRKPKGGKIVKANIDLHENVVEQKLHIMHLKCKMCDLINNEALENINVYNPNIVKQIDAYNSKTDFNQYSLIEPSQNNEVIEVNKTESKQSSINKDKESKKKMVNMKLKELENKLYNKNISKKSSCFWCTYDFNTPSIHIPKLYHKSKYEVYGCFCSPECACSFLFSENIDTNTKFERYQLLNYIYGSIYNYEKDIKPAPNPFYTLNKFYGNLSIQEYRQLLQYDRLILVIDKPLTKIYPELHEDNNDFQTIYDNKISLKKNNKINKSQILNKVFSS
jgi:hypothetical protein